MGHCLSTPLYPPGAQAADRASSKRRIGDGASRVRSTNERGPSNCVIREEFFVPPAKSAACFRYLN